MTEEIVKKGMTKAKDDFLKNYSKADLSRFYFDVDISEDRQQIEKTYTYYRIDEDTGYDVESDTFWRQRDWVKYLNLTKKDQMYYNVWGKKYTFVRDLIRRTEEKMKYTFKQQYRNADISKFSFEVLLDDNGKNVVSRNIYYILSDKDRLDITSSVFKDRYSNNLYWSPRIWDSQGTVQDFKFRQSNLPFDISNFKIYVNSNDFFESHFTAFDTKWANLRHTKDITAYILSYKCGLSVEHLTESLNTPKIITSMARYFLYYHMARFLRNSNKIGISNDEIKLIQSHVPTKKIWKEKYLQTKTRPTYWYNHNPKKKNIRHVHKSRYGSQFSIWWSNWNKISSSRFCCE